LDHRASGPHRPRPSTVTTEFDRWEIREQKVADRLDALSLDVTGAPVLVEFKRDKATDTVELQALKYAAYCSRLTLDELSEEFAATRGVGSEEARELLVDHAPALEDGVLRSVKIRLVAGSFGPAVTSVVLWLREYDIDIGCIEVWPGASRTPARRSFQRDNFFRCPRLRTTSFVAGARSRTKIAPARTPRHGRGTRTPSDSRPTESPLRALCSTS
jgi:hypothetical protein